MPSEQRIEVVLDEIAEIFDSAGDEVLGLHGPVSSDDEDDEDVESLYYLFIESDGKTFYVAASTQIEVMGAIYPYNISRHLGDILPNEETEELIDEDLNLSEASEDEYDKACEITGRRILSNTPPEIKNRAQFNLAAYGSSDLVDLRFSGDIREFRTNRTLYPYDEPLTLKEINDRAMSSVNLGRRAQRYVESSFFIELGEEDEEPSLNIRF